jgi:hypothetical protein
MSANNTKPSQVAPAKSALPPLGEPSSPPAAIKDRNLSVDVRNLSVDELLTKYDTNQDGTFTRKEIRQIVIDLQR